MDQEHMLVLALAWNPIDKEERNDENGGGNKDNAEAHGWYG